MVKVFNFSLIWSKLVVEDFEDKFGTGSILPRAELRKELGLVVGLDHELENSTALFELTGSLVI